MKILVIGSGAREHAIVRSLMKDDGVQVVCAPGNAGIALDIPVFSINPTDSAAVVTLAQDVSADLVVIGPEAPLVAGVADVLRAAGIATFGPSAAAAQLEGSKAFAKEIMQIAGVPTAASFVCRTLAEAEQALDEFGAPYVVKDDGLAAGKGVVVTSNRAEALAHTEACLTNRVDGSVVIEEYLDGPEISLFGISDGDVVVPLVPAQDFKRAYNDDLGPNTGGMGAYSPLPWAPNDIMLEVRDTVLQPMIDTMSDRGTPFSGLLYAGLAMTSRGIRVIEFNARFGDPETQVVLSRLASPLSSLLLASATGTLESLPALNWRDDAAITVVMAAAGYPESPQLGATISGLDSQDGATIFHAGTKRDDDGHIVVNGGRVLSVTALGSDLVDARRRVYEAVDRIHFTGEHHRTDIALSAANGEIRIP